MILFREWGGCVSALKVCKFPKFNRYVAILLKFFVGLLLLFFIAVLGLFAYYKSYNFAQSFNGAYFSLVLRNEPTAKEREKIIAENGAEAHKIFAERPAFYQKLVYIKSSDSGTSLDAIIMSEKGTELEKKYSDVAFNTNFIDALKYLFLHRRIGFRLYSQGKEIGVLTTPYIHQGRVLINYDISLIGNGQEKYPFVFGHSTMEDDSFMCKPLNGRDFESWRNELEKNLAKELEKREERFRQADRKMKNIEAYYSTGK